VLSSGVVTSLVIVWFWVLSGFSVLFGFVSVSGIISQRRNNIIGRYFPLLLRLFNSDNSELSVVFVELSNNCNSPSLLLLLLLLLLLELLLQLMLLFKCWLILLDCIWVRTRILSRLCLFRSRILSFKCCIWFRDRSSVLSCLCCMFDRSCMLFRCFNCDKYIILLLTQNLLFIDKSFIFVIKTVNRVKRYFLMNR
jgi:hypothetical protein